MLHVNIEVIYETPNGTKAKFQSNDLSIDRAIVIAEDFLKTGRVKNINFIDHNNNYWNLKKVKKYVEGIQSEPHHVKLYFDGNFDLETGKAGLGCVIYYDQSQKSYRLRKNALVKEILTNNEAEYAALHLGIKELDLLGVNHLPVQIIGDSLLVIKQMKDEWPCYEQELITWANRIDSDMERLGITPYYKNVSRTKNKEADHLATQAINKISIMSTKELD